MKKNINIEDGTCKTQVRAAIRKYEIETKTTVLTFFVSSNHYYTIAEFDGICVSKWFGKIENFINGDFTKQELYKML